MKPKTLLSQEEYDGLEDDHILRDAYEKQANGKFTLQIESVDGRTLEDASGLRSALSKEREAAKTAKASLERFGDLDPESARDALSRIQSLGDNPEEKHKATIDALRHELSTKHEREIKGKTREVEDLVTQLQDHLLRRSALSALAKHKGNAELLLPHVTAQMKMVKNGDGRFESRVVNIDGTERVTQRSGSTDPMGVEELVSLMRENATFQPGFEGVEASGGGTPPASEGSSPTATGSILRIKGADQEAINQNWQRIADGTALVVD